MKRKTKGLDLKLPIQAVITLVTAALAYYGIELDATESAALGVVVGFIVAYFGPAPETELVAPAPVGNQAGQVNVIAIAAITALAVALLVYILLEQ